MPPPTPHVVVVVVELANKDAGPTTAAAITAVAAERYIIIAGLAVATVTASDSKAPDRAVDDSMIPKNRYPASWTGRSRHKRPRKSSRVVCAARHTGSSGNIVWYIITVPPVCTPIPGAGLYYQTIQNARAGWGT